MNNFAEKDNALNKLLLNFVRMKKYSKCCLQELTVYSCYLNIYAICVKCPYKSKQSHVI